MSYIINGISFILILGVMIFLHELGHFLAARLFRIRVETFSLGFGKRLCGLRRNGVDYRLSAIPLGGYVKMAGENIGEPTSGAPDEFLSRPRYQRALVMLAGPLMNLILALCLMTVNYTVGIEIPAFYHQPARVGYVLENSPGTAAKLAVGDEILSIGDVPVKDWEDFQLQAISFSRQSPQIVFRRNGQIMRSPIALRETTLDPSEISGLLPFIPARIASITAGYPAETCGLKPGDIIRSASDDHRTAIGYFDISRLIQARIGQPVKLAVERAGKMIALQGVPVLAREGEKRGVLGFTVDIATMIDRYSLPRALVRSFQENRDFVVLTYKVLGKVVVGRLSFNQLSGPIGIAKASGDAVKSRKLTVVFSFMALISINLAVLNLLPIPVLDGGMIFLLLIEMAIRRDLPTRLKERAIQVGFVILVMVMVVVIFFDLLKSFGRG